MILFCKSMIKTKSIFTILQKGQNIQVRLAYLPQLSHILFYKNEKEKKKRFEMSVKKIKNMRKRGKIKKASIIK